ncbi:hypothetical protein [Apilactobacillus timberlakei]|uniref:Uncharacterized protein n=1 Tax=Apilactobacillus timberlakei TaxID=2008380 RepID=A0ABY2YRV9_9LACO|nr:hypothetical protein [Apilactobacillus timberlakei]TPR13454.1 hypothetical protein DY048_05990 [Apilactobacillus timberlakei]TPR15527.1 hypothetical protein DY052_05275 [Apilactobacillus timberlakei]
MNTTAELKPVSTIYVHFDNREHISIKIPKNLKDIIEDVKKCENYSKKHKVMAISLKAGNRFMKVKTFTKVLILNEFSRINYTYLSSINTLDDSFNKKEYSKGIKSITHGIANKHENTKDLYKTILNNSINALSIDNFALVCSMDYKMDHNNLKWLS